MEHSIVMFSEAKGNLLRLDAEHYQEVYLENRNCLSRFGAVPLGDLVAMPVKTGHTPSMKNESYYGGEIRFVKTDNLREFKISGEFSDYLSESGNEVIKGSELQAGDLIVTIIGGTHKIVGRAAVVREKQLPANINQNIALVRLKPTESPEFLSAYLNSEVGRKALWHVSRQTEQVNLNCREVEQILVPTASADFSRRIESLYKLADLLEDESEEVLVQAQVRLLAEIGLLEWEPNSPLTFEVYFSELQRAGRFDAEYFQPKYQEIVEAIKGYAGGWDRLGNLVRAKAQNFVPDDDAEYRYIELSNIGGSGEITGCMEGSGKSLPTRARRRVAAGDVIVSSIEGSLGSIAMIDEEYDQALCSTGFHVINSDRLNSETLLVLLKSVAGQLQLKRGATGTILTAINRDEFSQVVLPLVSEEAQAAIREMVTEANDLRQESKYLLACAIRAVEIAIEQDEETAAGWLETEIEGVG